MRFWSLALMLLAAGCSNAPETIWLGEFESPCRTSADCDDGPCLVIDGVGTCTERCRASGECPDNYVCRADQGACVPSGGGSCRQSGDRCGPQYPACCDGYGCVEFDDWGPRCVRVGCDPHDDYECGGFCCVAADTNTVCAPPSYCPD
jgi:hypothetical protein